MNMLEQSVWAELYRPNTVADCILPAETKKQVLDMISNGNIPHLLFSSGPGMGKCLDPDEEIEIFVSDDILHLFS